MILTEKKNSFPPSPTQGLKQLPRHTLDGRQGHTWRGETISGVVGDGSKSLRGVDSLMFFSWICLVGLDSGF